MPFKNKEDKAKYMDKYNARPGEIRRRTRRNAVRARLEDQGRVHKGDGKEVDHETPISQGGGDGDDNVSVKTREENRKKYNKKGKA